MTPSKYKVILTTRNTTVDARVEASLIIDATTLSRQSLRVFAAVGQR